MATSIVDTEYKRSQVLKAIGERPLPLTVTITKGKNVSYEQHKLENMWHREASDQLEDDTPEGKRAYCKLHFGVAIMHGEDDVFREAWDKVLRHLTYEQKIEAMGTPLDFPVTRHMTSKQKFDYLEAIHLHYIGLGVILTEPR